MSSAQCMGLVQVLTLVSMLCVSHCNYHLSTLVHVLCGMGMRECEFWWDLHTAVLRYSDLFSPYVAVRYSDFLFF